MKILAINGSPHEKGNTYISLKWALDEIKMAGHETEIIHLGGQAVRGCLACGTCGQKKNMRCAIDSDPVNDIILKMSQADALLLGSPVYFSDLTPELKALIDRSGYVLRANGNPMARKPGAAVVAGRRAGHIHTYDSINHYFGIMSMFTVGSNYWNVSFGRAAGEVANDQEGEMVMRNLGQNMAWLLGKLHQSAIE